jgi:rhodanese-related sulfurtransferase
MARRSIDEMLQEARARLQRLTPAEAHAEMQQGALLIDTRSSDLRGHEGAIPGALELPLNVLEWRVDPESGHRDPAIGGLESRLILICAHGYSSSLAAARVQDLGFVNATDVEGGFAAWAEAGLPVRMGP